ncbi:hypothetical protein AcW1_006688 [Taiwanofungus camphoratus]|nr:hypothetical protein AcV5_009275 [Antrodia cinnamomea]KAI0924613.1 hypothetical protein AcW2_005451 [Antrodia cinnamomea]KAI0954028.1 hypothetical protein AcV7_007382 [Antrodia cinnamomea]KAI0954956.1 hypothetical protein AcW1_006688 [Antrodia cinnamomea]
MSSSVFQSGSAPSNVQPSPSPSHSVPSPQSQQLSPFLPNAEASQHQEPQSPMHKCQWGGCFATFSSLAELVGHVNLQHLRIPSPVSSTSSSSGLSPGPKVPHTPQIQQQINNASMDTNALSCLWADCQLYPTPQSIPGPSTGNAVNSALGLLASHLLEDHLGLPARTPKQEQAANKMQGLLANPAAPIVQPQPQPHAFPSPASVASSGNDAANSHTSTPAPSSHTGTPAPSGPPAHGPPTPVPEHDCSAPSAHVCRWAGCTETFGACDALTAHITAAHVGGGRAHYDCFWGGCTRNGEQGFASKQKILRHLQSHTGHRPFQCKICSQNFSEAATLAQHMRRHTQEKPYVCDFPGCTKAFAIAGALTIHKRTHNGHKPFKCTYCDKAFSESSNLSKHLRTHTGARPYHCAEPNCNKSFARPDQLARHMNVHRKKAVPEGSAVLVTAT